jgi:hypothetical protein
MHGKGRERSINQILPEKAEKLQRLLRKLNNNRSSSFKMEPYRPVIKRKISPELGKGGEVPVETSLQAWIMENIDKDVPVFSDFVPSFQMEYFGNWITYGIGGESVDMLVTYKDKVRYKAVPIELKKDAIDINTIEQIYRYAYWIAQFSTANAEPPVESLTLQPIGIGYRISQDVIFESEKKQATKIKIPYPEHPCEVTVEPPILLTYKVIHNTTEFNRGVPSSHSKLSDFT